MAHFKKIMISFFLMTVLLLSSFPTLVGAASSFKDVKKTHGAYSSIEWAYNKGIIKGYPDGTFLPRRSITEAQFVSMLIRFDCSPKGSLQVSSREHKSSGNYRYLDRKNIPLNGYTNTKLRDQPITKGQAARIIAAFQGVDLHETYAVHYLYINDLANGTTGKNDYKDYSPNLSMTRADTAVLLHRLAQQGDCWMLGLNKKANGSDNSNYNFPSDFLGNGTVWFPEPEDGVTPPASAIPTRGQSVEFDIAKQTLIANGLDSTFVTLSLKSCSAGPIAYEDSISFSVTSELGAKLDDGKFGSQLNGRNQELGNAEKAVETAQFKAEQAQQAAKEALDRAIKAEEAFYDKMVAAAEGVESDLWTELNRLSALAQEAAEISKAADAELKTTIAHLEKIRAEKNPNTISLHSTSTITDTDGPELTVEVTAPKSEKALTDTITFQLNGKDKLYPNMDCYNKPITVQLNYVPQAELRLETKKVITHNAAGVNQTLTTVTATIVRPGGEPYINFNGSVRFRSPQAVGLSNEYAHFQDGVATITASTPWTTEPVLFDILADLDQVDPRYKEEIAAVMRETHSEEVHYEQPLRVDVSCSLEDPEIAFIIDSSGSMQRSDPSRLRVSKSKEFILALNASKNIGSHFNNKGHLLSDLAPAVPVSETFNKVIESGGTDIAGGLKVAFGKFSGASPKVAILLTDGKSNKKKTLEMLQIAKDENIKIFTIGLGSNKQLDEALLQQIASETGGQYFHVAESTDLGSAYQLILSEITCGIPAPSCSSMGQAFNSPSLEYTKNEFFISTFINERCGNIAKVVLRFNSSDGDIDYTLISRGQKFYALTKKINEISNFDLYEEGIFLAYNTNGELVGKKAAKMIERK